MRKRAFTMIEILVVMSIILVLMGILIPSVSKAMKKAKKQKAFSECKTLVMAIKQYETTYGFLPMTGFYKNASNDVIDQIIPTGDDLNLLLKTLAADSSEVAANPRKIRFLDCDYDDLGNPEFIDPWGNEIIVSLDLDFNGELDDTAVSGYVNAGTSNILKTTIATWSKGPDGQEGGVSDDASELNDDNIRSWTKKP